MSEKRFFHSRGGFRSPQEGTSLLEVLIAVLVMAIGLLGIAALQAVSLRNTEDSSARSNAVIQTYAMLDMLRANREIARAGQYDQGWLCEVPEVEEDEAPTRIDTDVGLWISQMQQSLGPTACGEIECGSTECTVRIRWDDSRATGGSEGSDDTEEEPIVLETTTRL